MKKGMKKSVGEYFTICLCLLILPLQALAQEQSASNPSGVQSAETSTVETGAKSVTSAPSQPPIAFQKLSASQKLEYGAKVTYLNPGTYIGPAFRSYFTQRNELPVAGKTTGDNFADGLSFYGRYFALQSTANFLASGVYPALFKQDPRYFPSPKKSFGARLLFSSSQTFLTRSDAGRLQYNYSKLAGFMTSAAIANAYEKNTPKALDAQGRIISINQRTGPSATFRNFGILIASDVIGNVLFNEFRLGAKMATPFKKLFGK